MTENETEEKKARDVSFLEALYGDPLRAETMRTGRYLVIASSICMAVVLFKVRLQSTSLIPLDVGERVDVLPMLLSIAVFLLLLSFVLRATTDVLHDRETALLVTRYIENERVKAAEMSARETDTSIAESQREHEEGPYEPDPWWEPYLKIKEAADAAVSRAELRVGVRSIPRGVRLTRKVLEIAVPLVFAVTAVVLSRGFLGTFFGALFTSLKP